MEQISETRTSLAAEFAAQLRHDGGHDEIADYIEESAALRDKLSGALTAARIEAERQGMERAAKIADAAAEQWTVGSAKIAEMEVDVGSNMLLPASLGARDIAREIRHALAKELPHDH